LRLRFTGLELTEWSTTTQHATQGRGLFFVYPALITAVGTGSPTSPVLARRVEIRA